jgi:dihydrofolate reductase
MGNNQFIVSCIVAIAENGVIGRQGALPWRLSSDLKRFRQLTLGHPLIMGRKTFEAIGKPLDSRDNIVVTSDTSRVPRLPGVLPARSLKEAVSFGAACASSRNVNEIFIIGGGLLFDEAMKVATRIYLTRVHGSPAGDVCWEPDISRGWREVSRAPRDRGPDDEYAVTDVVLERSAPDQGAALGGS